MTVSYLSDFSYRNGLPIECKFINWESGKIVPPAHDVSSLLITNTTEETRQHHLHRLLDLYYQSLSHELLESSDFDIKSLLPRSEFEHTSRSFLRTSKLFNALHLSYCDLEAIKGLITDEILVTREDCYKVLGKLLGSSQYRLKSYKEERFSEKCGFLGDHKKLSLEIERSGKTERFSFFVKGMPLEPSQRKFVEDVGLCRKETSFFNDLVGMVKENGIDLLDRVIPKCYLALKNELLIFEDLSARGFDKLYMRESYDFETVSLVLKKIAAFHASFLILEERLTATKEEKYRIIDHFKEELSEPFYNDTLISVKSILSSRRSSGVTVDMFCLNQEGFKGFVASSIGKQPEQVKPSSRYRNTVCHGDLWTNNILLKFDHQNNPIDCLLVDLQTLRYNPPAHDVMTFLYLTTNRSFRTLFMSQCLEIYYQALSEFLIQHQVEVADVVSWEDFLGSCREAKEFAVNQSLTHFQNIMMTSEQVKELFADLEFGERHMFEDRSEYVVKLCRDDGEYREKLGEAVSDLMEVYREQLLEKKM